MKKTIFVIICLFVIAACNNEPQCSGEDSDCCLPRSKWEKLSFAEVKPKADSGDAQAQYELAIVYALGRGVDKDMQKALELYKKASEQGHRDAALTVSEMYLNGDVEVNEKEALKYLDKAVAKPCSGYDGIYGDSYMRAGDNKKAVPFLQKAAEENDPIAQHSLGLMYLWGEVDGSKKPNIEEAKKWFKKAAYRGVPQAQFALQELEKKERFK